MKTIDPQDYEISIRKVREDSETVFRATVRELPDVAVYEDTYAAAYDVVCDVIRNLYEQAKEQKRNFPAPFADDSNFTGRVTLRMPKNLHRQIATVSRAEGVSLNHLITTALATYVGTLMTQKAFGEQTGQVEISAFEAFSGRPIHIQESKVLEIPADTSFANPWKGQKAIIIGAVQRKVVRDLPVAQKTPASIGLRRVASDKH